MRLNNRLIVRGLIQSALCVLFFWLGGIVTNYNNGCHLLKKHLSPDHQDNPDLVQGFHSGLKHQKAFLQIVILSAPRNLERRDVIRQTYLNTKKQTREFFQAYFVIGVSDLADDTIDALNDENLKNKDLLLLPIADGYSTITEKILSSFVQLNRNVDFKYLLKVDDDSYVQLPAIIEELHNSNFESGLYWGFFDGRAPVIRKGKWAESDYILCDRYLPYALGGGYVLSQDLVKFIAENSNALQKFSNEDVSVGTWLAPLKIHRIHDVRFDTEFRSRGCNDKYLVSHKQSVEDVKSKHYSMISKGKLCEKEVKNRLSYSYNWSVLPSQCCERVDSSLP